MTFLEPNASTMIVMDGKRPVAKGRKWQMGLWLLQAIDASWVDPRARMPLRDDFPAGYQDMYSKYPSLLAVKSRTEARKIMQGLAYCKPYKVEKTPRAQPKVSLPGRNKKAARETRAA